MKNKIEGIDELVRTLKALPSEFTASSRGGIVALALRDAAKVVTTDIKQNAPEGVGEKYQYQSSIKGEVEKKRVTHGRLKRAVRIRRDKNPHLVGATENIQIIMRKGKNRLDMNGAWFWHMVNFGTEKQRANPFFTNGFDKNTMKLVPIVSDGLDKRLKLAVKKAARNGFEMNYG